MKVHLYLGCHFYSIEVSTYFCRFAPFYYVPAWSYPHRYFINSYYWPQLEGFSHEPNTTSSTVFLIHMISISLFVHAHKKNYYSQACLILIYYFELYRIKHQKRHPNSIYLIIKSQAFLGVCVVIILSIKVCAGCLSLCFGIVLVMSIHYMAIFQKGVRKTLLPKTTHQPYLYMVFG